MLFTKMKKEAVVRKLLLEGKHVFSQGCEALKRYFVVNYPRHPFWRYIQ
jgi:hypothetical protein